LNFLQIFKNTQPQNFIKILPVRAELFHSDGRTDRQTNIMKLKVAFLNFPNAPKIHHIFALSSLRICVFLPDYIHVSVVLIGNH